MAKITTMGLAAVLLQMLFFPAPNVYAADAAPDGMVLIPAGEFILGSNKDDAEHKGREFGSLKPWYLDEHPQQKRQLAAFWIDRYEVTNADYVRFVSEKNYWIPQTWNNNGYLLSPPLLAKASRERVLELAWEVFELEGNLADSSKDEIIALIDQQRRQLDDLPVTGVTWQNAHDYCQWRGKRLATELEWEKAARGPEGKEFPWGDVWNDELLNASGQSRWRHGVAPVGSYSAGRSPYGVDDLAGNVMEWVADWYGPYPQSSYRSDAFGQRFRVVRGGGWGGIGHYAVSHLYRAAYRFYLDPQSAFSDLGFRCAKDAAAE